MHRTRQKSTKTYLAIRKSKHALVNEIGPSGNRKARKNLAQVAAEAMLQRRCKLYVHKGGKNKMRHGKHRKASIHYQEVNLSNTLVFCPTLWHSSGPPYPRGGESYKSQYAPVAIKDLLTKCFLSLAGESPSDWQGGKWEQLAHYY